MGYHETLGCLTVEALSGALRPKNAVDEALKASAEISLGRYRDGCHRRRVVIQIGKSACEFWRRNLLGPAPHPGGLKHELKEDLDPTYRDRYGRPLLRMAQ